MRSFFLYLFIAVRVVTVTAQPEDLVISNGITFPLHQSHVGQIAFTSVEIPMEKFQETDFLMEYELTNKSNLYITVFMGNSLTNYLHRIAPELSRDKLVENGNYQFSFYVDQQLVYRTNLHPGAPYAGVKDKETYIKKPLINNQAQGSLWSQSAWNRFMNNGGDSALSDGDHLLKLEIRPYLMNPDEITGEILASGTVLLHVKRKPVIDVSTINLNEPLPYKDLDISTERFDRNKLKELKGNIDEAVFKNITSIVVLKKGKLLIEEYFNGANRNTLHDTRSVGKSFASTLTGIAIREGYLRDENMSLKSFYDLNGFSNYSPVKENITLKDLLTMSSSFSGNDDDYGSPGNEENMYPTSNWVKFALDLPVDSAYNSGWHYFTAGVVLLGDILNKKVPGGLEKYAAQKLFEPLGINNYAWQYTPQKVVNTAGGLKMNSLDFAKYGQLYKNRGQWKGKQILSKTWVDKTFTKHKPIPDRNNEYYGYLFWNKTYQVNDCKYETFYSAGNGGNKIYIFKDVPLVVVVTATAYGASYAHPQVDKMIEQYILPAVLDELPPCTSRTMPLL